MNNILTSFLIIIGWLFACILISIYFRKQFPNQRELSRKIVHIGIGPIILLAWKLHITSGIAIIVSSIVTLALILNYKLRFIPAIEDIERQSYGTIAYSGSITLLLILLWNKNPAAVCSGVLMMAFGDGLAGLIGKQMNSPSWKILGQRKSIIGTLTLAIVGIMVLMLITILSGLPIKILAILMITALAVILEQISFRGIDNITVPISVALSWDFLLKI